jgi:hypothetical protein
VFRELYEHLLLLPHQSRHNQRPLPRLPFLLLDVTNLYPPLTARGNSQTLAQTVHVNAPSHTPLRSTGARSPHFTAGNVAKAGKLGKRRYSGEDLGGPPKKAMAVSCSKHAPVTGCAGAVYLQTVPTSAPPQLTTLLVENVSDTISRTKTQCRSTILLLLSSS